MSDVEQRVKEEFQEGASVKFSKGEEGQAKLYCHRIYTEQNLFIRIMAFGSF